MGPSSLWGYMAQSAQSASGVAGPSPFDTVASAGSRFGIELVAWTAGLWAAADIGGSWWAAIPALVVLVGLPALFNTPGDKHSNGIATPGPVRIGIELFLLAVAMVGAWIVWPVWSAVAVSILGVAMVITGLPRYRWLAAGAPEVAGSSRLPGTRP